MPDGLKIIVGADVTPAEKAMKSLVTTAAKSGNQAGTALGTGLNKATPAIQKIQATAKPATVAVSKLGDSLETLRAKLLAKQSFLITEKDISKVAILNREIKALQSEIVRVQAVGASGVNLGGVGKGAKAGFSALKTAANILPGIGIAGLIGAGADLIGSIFTQSNKANDKVKELIVSVKDLATAAGAGTAGEAAKVNALVGVIANQTNSYEQRNNALKELQNINKGYFGDLTLEASKLELLKQRANEYTQAIVQQAVIKAFEDQIGKTAVAIAEQTKAFTEAIKKENEFSKAIQKSNRTGGRTNTLPGFVSNEATQLERQRNAAIKTTLQEGEALSKLRGNYNELQQAINDAVLASTKFKPLDTPGGKTGNTADKLINEAKKLAAFLNDNTQFQVAFEVDPFESEAVTLNKAKEFIAKAKKFFETQLPPFEFKPLIRPDFRFDEKKFLPQFKKLTQEAATKTYEQAKTDFEKHIETLAKNKPFVINVLANIQAGLKREEMRNAFDRSMFGINQDPVDQDGKPLFTDEELRARSFAKTINGVLTPAFQGLFAAIQAGENPLKAFFQSIGNAIGQLIQKLIAAAVQAAILSLIFPGGLGGTKGFAGFFKNIVGFASGGIVSGPVLAMVGEGIGTSKSNPEVIAPLDQLKGILAGVTGKNQMQPVVLTTRVRGNNLELISGRSQRRNGRAGS